LNLARILQSATFLARVAPSSEGSGYFDLIFLDQTRELKRFTIPLEPANLPLGRAASGMVRI
jgi:hypothetical protein